MNKYAVITGIWIVVLLISIIMFALIVIGGSNPTWPSLVGGISALAAVFVTHVILEK